MKRRLVTLSLLAVFAVQIGHAQSADVQSLVNDGNAAAHRDDHAEAISDYQKAIKLDPSVRESLLLKLGQQYLWSGQSAAAADLLGEFVKKHSADCSARSTYALALSWANRLKEAETMYRDIRNNCPELSLDAALGQARVLRWRERNRAAAKIYKQVEKNGTSAQQNDAKLGIALTELAQDENRTARDTFRQLASEPKPDPSAIEGLAVSDLHLGMPEAARHDLEAMTQRKASRSLCWGSSKNGLCMRSRWCGIHLPAGAGLVDRAEPRDVPNQFVRGQRRLGLFGADEEQPHAEFPGLHGCRCQKFE